MRNLTTRERELVRSNLELRGLFNSTKGSDIKSKELREHLDHVKVAHPDVFRYLQRR